MFFYINHLHIHTWLLLQDPFPEIELLGQRNIFIYKAFITFGQIAFHRYCTYFIHHQSCMKMSISSTCPLRTGDSNFLSSLPIQWVKKAYQCYFNFYFFGYQWDWFFSFIYQILDLYISFFLELHTHVLCPVSYWSFVGVCAYLNFNYLSAI